jgi:hypothetical protein
MPHRLGDFREQESYEELHEAHNGPTFVFINSSTRSSSIVRHHTQHFTTLTSRRHVLSCTFFLFPSIHQKDQPTLGPTEEVRFLLLLCLSACELTWPTGNSLQTTTIHVLDDESLLHLFCLYRPPVLDGNEDDGLRFMGGRAWKRELWWYKLAHVCQRWRNLIFGSASYLDLCLVCTYGTPIADMLAHSPPLPLVIDYAGGDLQLTAKVEEGIILALEQRDRVRRVRLVSTSLPTLLKLVMVMLEEYPVLEYLIMGLSAEDHSKALVLPERFQAPHLRHLLLKGFTLRMESRLLTTAVGLVTLTLVFDHLSAYFRPNNLLHWLSFMPQLETFRVNFVYPVSDDVVERQLMPMQTMTHVTLPSLRHFVFRGVGAHMGALAPWLTTPCLEKLEIYFNQLKFSARPFLQFMETAENLRFDSAKLEFDFTNGRAFVGMYLREDAETYPLSMIVNHRHLDEQVSFLAHIFNLLSQTFSSVDHLTFEHKLPDRPSEEHIEVDRTEWRRLLRHFDNVKTLRVNGGLVKELSRCLRLHDGELPLELLPKLQELTYWGPILGGGHVHDGFTSFADARQKAGRPVTLTRHRYLRYGH